MFNIPVGEISAKAINAVYALGGKILPTLKQEVVMVQLPDETETVSSSNAGSVLLCGKYRFWFDRQWKTEDCSLDLIEERETDV